MKRFIKQHIIYVITFLAACNYSTPETYLIPNGFQGRVNIIFNKPNTDYTPIENGRRVYRIPGNGILLTRSRYESGGFINHDFYYLNSMGDKTPLKIFKYVYENNGNTHWVVEDSVVVGIFEDGTVGSYPGREVVYEDFVVSSFKNLKKYNSQSANDSFRNQVDNAVYLNH